MTRASQSPETTHSINGRQLTVLIADDDKDSTEAYALYLRGRGWHVVEADDGRKVWPLTADCARDVIVMDLALPGVNGWTLTREPRTEPATTRIPVVVLSGHVMPAERERAMRAGCQDFLEKPCWPDVLERTLARVVGRDIHTTP